jgi:hypothetical protein
VLALGSGHDFPPKQNEHRAHVQSRATAKAAAPASQPPATRTESATPLLELGAADPLALAPLLPPLLPLPLPPVAPAMVVVVLVLDRMTVLLPPTLTVKEEVLPTAMVYWPGERPAGIEAGAGWLVMTAGWVVTTPGWLVTWVGMPVTTPLLG